MLLRLFLLTFAIYTASAQQEQGSNIDALIGEVFGKPNDTNNNNDNSPLDPVIDTPNIDPIQSNFGNNGNNGGGIPGVGSGGIPGVGSCTCVPYYLCNNGTINTNGEGIIDIRINEGPCPSYIDVCCGEDDVTDRPRTPTPPPVEKSGCGYRNPDGIGFRITGDEDNEAEYGEFPWMVAVLREESINNKPQKQNVYQCGGALIHPQAVITAAHCVNGKNKKFKIRAGEWDTQTKNELFPHQDRDVQEYVVHPQYYAGALYNDIAILFLDSPIDIKENVDVLCLPEKDTIFDGERCIATGWGKDSFGKEGDYQVILKKIDLPVIDRDTCQTQLRKTRLGDFFELHKSFICAGGEEGKDTCKGDGGSPLICPIPGERNRYQHAGIVAWGIRCGDPDVPGVYSDVSSFRDWIDDNMRDKNFDTSFYQF